MFIIPETTKFDKRIPKQKFYEHADKTSALKKLFAEQVEYIVWKNKISPETTNLAPGKSVSEFEIIEIAVKDKNFGPAIIQQISKLIPYKIVFDISYGDEHRLWVEYSEGKTKHSIRTDWLLQGERKFYLKGLSVDEAWDNLIIQISDIEVETNKSLDEQIANEIQREKLTKEIARLEKLARAEKQPKKKFELVQKINEMKKEGLING